MTLSLPFTSTALITGGPRHVATTTHGAGNAFSYYFLPFLFLLTYFYLMLVSSSFDLVVLPTSSGKSVKRLQETYFSTCRFI